MSRRTRPALAAAAAVLALAAVPLALGPAAEAAPSSQTAVGAMPPPIGAEIPSSMLALDSQVRIGGDVFSVDFRGGISQRAEVNPDDPFDSVRLRTVGFRVTAELPGGEGTITLEQSDVDVDAASRLTQAQQFPARYEERDVIHFTATIDSPGSDPVVLEGAKPLVLTAALSRFPSSGDVYTLEAPVNLVDSADPNTVTGTLQTFTSRRGAL